MSEMEVPKGWELVKLGDTFEESNQKWLPNSKSKIINYVGLENIESNTGALVKFIPVESSKIKSSKTIFTKKTVLYGKLRPYLNKVLLPTFDGICSTDILSLTPKSNNNEPSVEPIVAPVNEKASTMLEVEVNPPLDAKVLLAPPKADVIDAPSTLNWNPPTALPAL